MKNTTKIIIVALILTIIAMGSYIGLSEKHSNEIKEYKTYLINEYQKIETSEDVSDFDDLPAEYQTKIESKTPKKLTSEEKQEINLLQNGLASFYQEVWLLNH